MYEMERPISKPVKPCKLVDLTVVENFNNGLRMSKRKSTRQGSKWYNRLPVLGTVTPAMKHGTSYSQLTQLNFTQCSYIKLGCLPVWLVRCFCGCQQLCGGSVSPAPMPRSAAQITVFVRLFTISYLKSLTRRHVRKLKAALEPVGGNEQEMKGPRLVKGCIGKKWIKALWSGPKWHCTGMRGCQVWTQTQSSPFWDKNVETAPDVMLLKSLQE